MSRQIPALALPEESGLLRYYVTTKKHLAADLRHCSTKTVLTDHKTNLLLYEFLRLHQRDPRASGVKNLARKLSFLVAQESDLRSGRQNWYYQAVPAVFFSREKKLRQVTRSTVYRRTL